MRRIVAKLGCTALLFMLGCRAVLGLHDAKLRASSSMSPSTASDCNGSPCGAAGAPRSAAGTIATDRETGGSGAAGGPGGQGGEGGDAAGAIGGSGASGQGASVMSAGEGGNDAQPAAGAGGGDAVETGTAGDTSGTGGAAGEAGSGGGGSGGGSVDPCVGVVCDAPPASTCFDANTRRAYAGVGDCSDGACSYAPTDTTCMFGCAANACNPDPCLGVTCTTPPANSCEDGLHLRAYNSTGSCSGGTCSYTSVSIGCTCQNNACTTDPCATVTCNTPPSPACADSMTRRGYASVGTCSGGSCSYAPTDTNCSFGCSGGSCNADPCAGVSCTNPPAASCPSSNTRRSYGSPGTCNAGACSYSPTDSVCNFGCSNGACNPDPCAGVTCNTPPAASCPDTGTSRTYASPGSCSGGTCSYSPMDSACGSNQQCSGGACSVCKTTAHCGASCAACGGSTPFCKDQGATSQCVTCLADSDCPYAACRADACPYTTHGFSGTNGSSANRFVDKLYCGRVFISAAGNLAALGVRTVTAGINVRLALYTDSSGAPLNRVAQTTELASLANGATEGLVSATGVSSGWHWICLLAAATVRINIESSVTQSFATGNFTYGPMPAVAPVLTAVSPDPVASDVYAITTPP